MSERDRIKGLVAAITWILFLWVANKVPKILILMLLLLGNASEVMAITAAVKRQSKSNCVVCYACRAMQKMVREREGKGGGGGGKERAERGGGRERES